MKTAVRTFAAAAAVILAASCAKQGPKSFGFISLAPEISAEVAESTKSHLSDFISEVPKAEDLNIVITDWDGDVVYEGKAGELDNSDPYLTGDYTITASYGAVAEEGEDKPRFMGQSSFTVVSGETCQVNVKASLANTILKLKLSDNFKNYYSGISTELETGSGNKFSLADGSAVFVEPFRFTLRGHVTTPQGKGADWEKTFESGIEPGYCYTVTIDASNIGASTITIQFNNDIQTVNLGEVDINE